MKTVKRVAIAAGILLAVLLTLCMPELRRLGIGWMRYHGIKKILNDYNTTTRANLMPVRKTFDTKLDGGHMVDIGFAKFAANEEEEPVSVHTVGSDGLSVGVTCKDFNIVFLNPSPGAQMDEDARRTMESSRYAYPKTAAFMQEMYSDEVAARIAEEETRPASFAEACAMNKDDYMLYNTKLTQKIIWVAGVDEVFWFENGQIKGLAQIGKSVGNREQGHLLLGSSDGGKVVGCLVYVQEGKQADAGKMIEQIAASFVFTVDNIADKNEIRRRISVAGIGK